jgi:hypothetical protein
MAFAITALPDYSGNQSMSHNTRSVNLANAETPHPFMVEVSPNTAESCDMPREGLLQLLPFGLESGEGPIVDAVRHLEAGDGEANLAPRDYLLEALAVNNLISAARLGLRRL